MKQSLFPEKRLFQGGRRLVVFFFGALKKKQKKQKNTGFPLENAS